MESLNPQHPREGIEEMKLPHADLIRSRPWNQMEVRFCALGFGGEHGRGRAWEGELRELGRVNGSLGVRERDLNDVGPKTVDIGQTGQTGCRDRSDRSGPG